MSSYSFFYIKPLTPPLYCHPYGLRLVTYAGLIRAAGFKTCTPQASARIKVSILILIRWLGCEGPASRTGKMDPTVLPYPFLP